MRFVCCVLSLSLCLAAGTSTPSCISDSGSHVDFAYAFKYPKGFEYAYMDSDHKLFKSAHTLDSSSSSISKTIEQRHNSGVSYVMWNDEPPKGSKSAAPNAHAKGLLLFTSSGGVWLTHSLPLFPSEGATSASGLWADASEDFGQSYLCITVTAAEIHKLAPMFKITRPTVYASSFASGAESTFSDIKEVVDKDWDKSTMTTTVSIKSKAGQTFTVYGKAGHWGDDKDPKADLYRDLVEPALGEKLYMEGWRRGRGVWGPACGKDEVLDITAVTFPGNDWDTMNDHSKWAVGESGTAFCVGDLNRADGQDKRGGATVCIHDSSFSSQMRNVISTTDKCDGADTNIVQV